MNSNQHVAESLRSLVVDLSEQVMNSTMNSVVLEPTITENESYSRKKDVVRKSIKCVKKQLEQMVSVEMMIETLEISLIKKYKPLMYLLYILQ